MAVYVLVDIDVREPGPYEDYKRGVPPLIARHGGEYLVRGGAFEVIEGSFAANRLVLFRFPDRASVQAFWDDPEYQDLKTLRRRVAETTMVVIEGV